MRRLFIASALVVLVSAALPAFEAAGTILKVDVEKGVVSIRADGKDRIVSVDKAVTVLDQDGRPLPGGLAAKELKAGTDVVVTVDTRAWGPVILQRDTTAVLKNAKSRFPNLRVAYLGSRIYGGWTESRLNPEPYAYEGAFVVRWMIRDQIAGDAALNYSSTRGAVNAPLLLWGPYLWADGTRARTGDGLTYERGDLAEDGTHPSPGGRRKVADMLLRFFQTDSLARTWYSKK